MPDSAAFKSEQNKAKLLPAKKHYLQKASSAKSIICKKQHVRKRSASAPFRADWRQGLTHKLGFLDTTIPGVMQKPTHGVDGILSQSSGTLCLVSSTLD